MTTTAAVKVHQNFSFCVKMSTTLTTEMETKRLFTERQRHSEAFLNKSKQKHVLDVWGPHGTMESILASHPAAPGSILGVPKQFSSLDVAEIY